MDINKLIQDNLLISLIAIIVPTVAVAWKIMETLFIKPREFRIDTLKQDLDRLRNEFLRIEKQQGEKIEQEESKQSKNKIIDKEDVPQIIKVENQILSFKHLNTLQELFSAWKDKNITDLQRKRIEDTFSGKEFVWDVFVLSISEITGGKIFLTIIANKEVLFDSAYALAYFDSKDEEALMLLGKGEKIRIKGTVDRFFLSPILKDCKLLNRLKE